ncbi:MAG: hypothetical protein KAR16_13920, partial [Bacteroidales bacterium]|nr:hypothetical protein [Bacteroidales bacterium]
MKRIIFPASFCLIFLVLWSCNSDAPKTEEPKTEEQNNIRAYLSAVAADITDHTLSDITSLPDWEKQRL